MISQSPEKTSKLTIILTAISFAMIGLAALYFAIVKTSSLILDATYLPESIDFNKGALYLWGVSFVLLFFVAGIIYTNFFKGNISNKLNKRLTQLVIFLLIFTFTLPQVVNHIVDSYLQEQGYTICESKSKQWLHVKTIVYSKQACIN
ncbi:MAG: hypothetical protein QM484_13620 [Woeseiaceae bacterium]